LSRGAAVVALVVAVALGQGVGAAPASAAVASSSCSFASPGTGTYASTLCWFDLTGYNTGATQFTEALPGGYTASFTMSVSGGPVRATSFPTWSGSYLGNGVYTGVKGNPALYQTTAGTTTTATLTSVSVTDKNGIPVTGYSLVGADAEATGPNESITWTSSNPISSLQPIGNACGNGFTGVGTTTVACKGSSTGSGFTGDAILASTAPSQFSQTMVGGGLEGVAFGILVSAVELDKTVVNGYAGDAFGVSITAAGSSSVLGSGNTNGGTSASTGSTTVITSAAGSTYTLAEQATSGTLSNYTASWSCTRNGASSSSLPSGAAGSSANVTVGIGDLVACTITNTAIPSSVSLVKHAGTPVDVNGDGLTDTGDTIQYTFTVTNTGRLVLDDVAVSDAKAGTVTCPQSTLAPGASELCTADAPYTITAADVTAGAVDNAATASGAPVGTTARVTSSVSSTHTPTTAPAPSLTLVKSADPSTEAEFTPGQTITYHFVVTNTGNVPMSGITIDEGSFTGSGTLSPVTCPDSTLPVNGQETCTASYTLSPADVDQGSVTNTATVEGTPPGSAALVPSRPSTATVPTPADPGISVVKTADPGAVTAAGQTVTYRFTVTNTGNVTLSGVAVDDSDFTGTGTLSAIDCPETSLFAGQAETCTATYQVTQADMDAGTISNSATAHGTPPGSTAPTDSIPSISTVTATQRPALDIVKTASTSTVTTAGQVVTYTFRVTNTGNVTITGPTITDSDFTGNGTLGAITCPAAAGTLDPGETVDCSARYTVVAADLTGGTLSNTATVTGELPGGGTLTSDPSTATVREVSPVVAVNTGGYVVNKPIWQRLGAVGGLTAALLALGVGLMLRVRRGRDARE